MVGGPPEGWYEDPKVAGQERWWDGQAWSMDRVRPTRPALIEPSQLAFATPPAFPSAAEVSDRGWRPAEPPAAAAFDRDEAMALLHELQSVEERLRTLQVSLHKLLDEVGAAVEGRR